MAKAKKGKKAQLAKFTAVTLNNDDQCDSLVGDEKKVFDAIVKHLKMSGVDGPQQGRMILLFEPRKKTSKPK